MAKIIKIRARVPIAEGAPNAGIANFREDGGLTFRIEVGEYKVILTHVERDALIETWTRQQKDYER